MGRFAGMPPGAAASAVFALASEVLTFSRAETDELVRELTLQVRELERQNELLREQLRTRGGDAGVFEDERGVFAQVQVAQPLQRTLFERLRPAPSSIWLEVGANNIRLLRDLMPDAFAEGAVLLSFEPLLDKYASILGEERGRRGAARFQLGMSQHERAFAFPFAVGCEGMAQFHVTPMDGCSSLLTPRAEDFASDPLSGRWGDWIHANCASAVETRWVPCVSLEHIIDRWLGGREVAFLDVDAQGSDLNVVLSAGRHVDKLLAVSLEVQCDGAAGLYAGAPNCTGVYGAMRRLGFVTDFQPATCRRCTEAYIFFQRPGVALPAAMEAVRRKIFKLF